MKYLQRVIEYGVYGIALLLSLQTRWILQYGLINKDFYEYSTISVYAVDILIVIVSGLFFLYSFREKKIKSEITNKDNIWFIIGILEFVIFVSCFVAEDRTVAFMNYGRFLLGIALFWLIIRVNYNKLKFFYSFLLGILFQAVIGFLNFAGQIGFASKWLGMAKHNPNDLGVSVVETIDGMRWLRAYGAMDHPNILGGLLLVGVVVSIYLIVNKKFEARRFSVYYFLCGFLGIVLFMTFSRSAWVGMIIFLIITLLYYWINKNTYKQKKLLEIILILGITAFVFFIQNQNLVLTRLAGDTRLEMKSDNERVASIQVAKTVIQDYWLLGTGIGNYGITVNKNYIKNEPAWFYQPVHNTFLLIFAEIGVFGIITFLFFIAYFFYLLIHSRLREKKEVIGFALVISILVMFLVDHWWWSLHFGILFFWFLIGIFYREVEED